LSCIVIAINVQHINGNIFFSKIIDGIT